MTMERLADVLVGIREEAALRVGPKGTSSSSGTRFQEPEPCPTCRGAGFLRYNVPVGDPHFGKITPCPECWPERERERLARVARRISAECGLEPELRTKSLENFETYPGNGKALEAARLFVERGIEAGAWLVIRGTETGTGKTHLLAAIANAAIARGIPTIYTYTTDLLDHLRAGYKRGTGRHGDGESGAGGEWVTGREDGDDLGDFDDRWERVKAVDLLLLDDVGVQVNSPWVRERLDALIDARYRGRRPTVITTNLGNAELARISPRVFDRLDRHEPAAVVEVNSIKYRLWKRQQGLLESTL